MPPRRKRAAGKAATEEVSKKKVKSEPIDGDDDTSIDGVTVHWEWEGDGSVWTRYSEEHRRAINKAINDKQKDYVFTAGSAQLRVIFDKLVQRNTKTGWERRVRMLVQDSDTQDFMIWEWQQEPENSTKKWWEGHTIANTLHLEKTKAGGEKETKIKIKRTNYTVDLESLDLISDDTGDDYLGRRVKADAKEGEITSIPAPKTSKKGSAGATNGAGDTATKSTSRKGRSSAAKGSAGSKIKQEAGESPEKIRTVTMKGAAPVDPECPKVDTAHVYSEGKEIYDSMLNQTNLQNNNNKYYLLQVLEDDARKAFSVWFRWGRVGFPGQSSLVPCGTNIEQAKKTFCKKFQDKTKNDWANRKKFVKIPGKYDMVDIDYSAKTEDEVDSKQPEKKAPKNIESNLEKKVQDLINLICDVKSMEDMVVEMKYDAKKAPLGKLTSAQIKAGYSALKIIDTCITNNDFGQKLIHACDDFYTRIPHSFGMQRPPVIRTKDVVKAKMQLLEALSDIEVAMKIIKERVSTENPVDTHYNSLKCGLQALDAADADYKMVEDYLQNTHAKTHNQYKMQILDMFACDKQGDDTNYNDFGNKMLLWHGSRLTNWVGILSQGLRIAPPEAPVTGYMFGKGVYFADMSSKSANYCFANRSKDVGLLLLCEVSLGNMNELLDADYKADKLPAGKHSVKGQGAVAPNPSKTFTLPDGVAVPMGKAVNTGVVNPSGYTLNYNEFIVYDTKQVKLKYLLKIKFNFK